MDYGGNAIFPGSTKLFMVSAELLSADYTIGNRFFILLIGHLVFAGWGIKKILEESGISGRLGLLGAGMFMFSPKIISHIEEGVGVWQLQLAGCRFLLGFKK